MTFQTGTATDLEDLLSKLDTFAVTTHGGWTRGYTTNPQTTDGWFELHKGSLSFSAKYPVGAQGPPEHMSLHQATAFVGTSTAPGAHTADSGNGYNTGTTGHTNANLLTERCVRDIGNGPYLSYHFFADDTGPADYIYVVVQVEAGKYRHFGFGILDKYGDNWTGGEFVYGHYMDTGGVSPLDVNHQGFFDALGGSSDAIRAATIRTASALENVGAAVYSVSAQVASASIGTDTAGNVRRQLHGGFRGGPEMRTYGNPLGNASSGVIPMTAISAWYRDPNNARVQYLGAMADVRQVNVRNFEPGQEVVIGVDTWVFFPWSIRTTATVESRSNYLGVAYKKIT